MKIYVHDQAVKQKHNYFAWLLVLFFLSSTIYFAWISLTIQADPIERTYQRYNHVQLYEDGSWSGETVDGEAASGCVKQGLCKD